MALILNLETATKNCSVSLSHGGQCISLVEEATADYSHGEQLHLFIDACLEKAGKTFSEIQAVSVSGGPGSYTGLRIGVSAAKGLCFALQIPLIVLPTLQVLAHQQQSENAYVIPLMDARRMEVYAAVFDSRNQTVKTAFPEVLTSESFQEYLQKKPVFFLGDGVPKFRTICNHPHANFLDNLWPSAKEMCSLSEEKFNAKQFEDLAYFEPFYLKEFSILKN